MTRRERLTATIKGKSVDRPAVSFYEIGGFDVDPTDPDPYNVYNDPSWKPLLDLAEAETDLIRFASPGQTPAPSNPRQEFFSTVTWEEGESRFTETRVSIGGRELSSLSRRDRQTNTLWEVKHLIKSEEDIRAYLELPDECFRYDISVEGILEAERKVGDAGIVMIDTGDPLCAAASLMAMEDFTVIAFTNPDLFSRLLEKLAEPILARTKKVAEMAPGRLWRIYGPEYATEPYLKPRHFRDYVVRYVEPMIRSIHSSGGWARVHCHGRIKKVLPMIVEMGADGIDPIEPPPQGDVYLADVRREYGKDLALFGNLEASDIENLPPPDFERVAEQSLQDGTAGKGRGFVLMPSASPYGRTITKQTMTNYETLVRLVKAYGSPA